MQMTNRRILSIIIAVSVMARAAAALLVGNEVFALPGTYDQISYHTLALRVLDGYGFTFGEVWWPITAANAPTSHWSFLYTAYLIVTYAIFGPNPLVARLLQAAIVGVAQPLLAYLIGRRYFNETTGLVGAALTAVYLYSIYYAANLMTEPFYITLILAVLYLSTTLADRIARQGSGARRGKLTGRILLHAAALGLALGATVLLRQVFMAFIPFLFLWLWWVLRKNHFWSAFGASVLAGVIVVLMILPFTFYNYARFNRFVLLNTNAGYAFYLANHPIYGTQFIPILPADMGSYQELIPVELRGLDEAALDQELLKAGFQLVADDPGRYLLLSFSRIPAFFMFWPSGDSGILSNISRVGSFGIMLPFMIYGLVLTLFSKKYGLRLTATIALPILFMLMYTAIHILSWSLVRYRLPIDAVLLVFAGRAFVDLSVRAGHWLAQSRPRKQALKQG